RQGSDRVGPSQQPGAGRLPWQLAAGAALKMITVHHLENSRSQRILWMLEELDLPYEIKTYKREPTMQAPAALKAIHPLGKSPVIVDDGVTLAESGAILEYLVQKYGKGRFVPTPGSEDWRRYVYFMHYGEGSLMPLLVMKLIFSRIPSEERRVG